MPYAVQPVLITDAPGLSRAMMSAWWEDEHWRVLWAKSGIKLEQIISDCIQRQPRSLTKGRNVKRHLKVVDTDSGEIVAYSRYIVPESYVDFWLEAQIPEPSPEEQTEYERRFDEVTDDGSIKGMDHDFVSEFGNPLEEVEGRILKDIGPCFAVDYMTTHPAHKGRGVASMMLKEALKRVDEAYLTSIVMASPAGRKLYEKHGFKFVRSLVQDDSRYGTTTPYVHSWLIRQPQNKTVGGMIM